MLIPKRILALAKWGPDPKQRYGGFKLIRENYYKSTIMFTDGVKAIMASWTEDSGDGDQKVDGFETVISYDDFVKLSSLLSVKEVRKQSRHRREPYIVLREEEYSDDLTATSSDGQQQMKLKVNQVKMPTDLRGITNVAVDGSFVATANADVFVDSMAALVTACRTKPKEEVHAKIRFQNRVYLNSDGEMVTREHIAFESTDRMVKAVIVNKEAAGGGEKGVFVTDHMRTATEMLDKIELLRTNEHLRDKLVELEAEKEQLTRSLEMLREFKESAEKQLEESITADDIVVLMDKFAPSKPVIQVGLRK